jgi:hypothetical protein
LAVALAGYALTGQPLPRVRFGASIAVFAVMWLILGYDEEVGWRALVLPQLLRIRSCWVGATMLGVLWCVWHYPKLFASPFLHFDAKGIVLVVQFSVQILIANYLLCWLFVRTKSAVVAALFHASWNLVASVYALAATDPLITLTLAIVTALILYLGRARLGVRLAHHTIVRKSSQADGGAVSLLFGLGLALYPAAGALVLLGVIAAYAITVGVLPIALGLRLRSLGLARQQVVARTQPPTP